MRRMGLWERVQRLSRAPKQAIEHQAVAQAGPPPALDLSEEISDLSPGLIREFVPFFSITEFLSLGAAQRYAKSGIERAL